MRFSTWFTAMALAAVVAAPARADDAQRRRPRAEGNQAGQTERASPPASGRERAVPRATAPQQRSQQPQRQQEARRSQPPRQEQVQRNSQARRDDGRRAQPVRPQAVPRVVPRPYDNGRYDARRYDNRGYDNRGYNGNRRYDIRGSYARRAPRIVRPTIVRVIPYRPYVYRPSFGIGVYYGSGGYYPYGQTPRGYYDPLPGRYYGGVRITGAPRDAQVFADGYYVGIVNDFDGIFQHMNLEAGPHHIEIDWGGYEPIAFDVYVRPGETTTFRADGYFGY